VPAKFLENARVLRNRSFAPGLYSLRLKAPRIAAAAEPGQFVQLELGCGAHVLRRPISLYQTMPSSGEMDLLYQVVGAGTQQMSTWREGEERSVLGPLGTSWPAPADAKRVLLIGGGIGTAPLAMLAQHFWADHSVQVTMIQAAQTADRLVARDLFEPLVNQWLCATDDGSAGAKGLITEPLAQLLETERFDVAYVCGPEVMQVPVVKLCEAHKLRCYVSLERRMACGIGACLGCVVNTTAGQQKVCQVGPIFDAKEVCWDDNIASRVH